MQDFLASSEDMTKFIATVSDAADQAREANNGTKDIALSFDEWGVWYSDKWNEQEDQWKAEAAQGLHHEPWPKSPHLLEDIYTAADAVVEGSLMITLLKHCDRVRSASRAQLVNVIAPIMAEEHGPAWRQTTFYPFAEAALHARGQAYAPAISSPTIHTEAYGDVPAIDAVVTWMNRPAPVCCLPSTATPTPRTRSPSTFPAARPARSRHARAQQGATVA